MAIGELEKDIERYTSRIEGLRQVQIPKSEQYFNDEVMRSYFLSLFGERSAERILKMYQETRSQDFGSDTTQFIGTIVDSYKNSSLTMLEGELELVSQAVKKLETSKSPLKDLAAVRDYIEQEREYGQRVAECGGCGFAAGEPPQKPKFLR